MGTDQHNVADGIFITFEGGEGTGKSTQIHLLSERLRAAGHDVVMTREPGGAPGAEDIRSLLVNGDPDRWTPMTEALLNFAARQEHLEHTVRPALKRGAWVLCDRFVDSTMAYQGYAGGVRLDTIDNLTRMVIGSTMPNLTLVLDLPIDVGLTRAHERGDSENRFERKGQAYHQKLRSAFLEIANAHPKRCALIEASGSIDDIAADVWSVVCERLSVTKDST